MSDKLKLVVCVVERDGKFLLPLKERKIGAGRRNGVGGKVEPGESFEAAAKREMQEETGAIVEDMKHAGSLLVTTPSFTAELEIFHVTRFSGEPLEQPGQGMTDFRWYPKEALPFELMWPNDVIWYPMLIAGKQFSGEIELSESGEVIRHTVRESDELKVH